MSNYYSLNEYCKDKFGHKLYKIALDGGMTCPNRDGTLGRDGCIFCGECGSGEFAEKQCGNITFQIENAEKRVAHKNKSGRYIAYFQSFTNTYAPVSYLERIFTEAINHPDIDVLSIATRPDCLGEEVLSLLEKLNRIKPVWVELGFQTSNEKSAEYIGRGYKNDVFRVAVKNLKKIGIEVVAHVIIGLPGETLDDLLNSVKYVLSCGINGIKLHLLYVVKGTRLEKEFNEGRMKCLEKDEYLDIIKNLIQHIPSNVVIHRLTGDGDKKTLVAPMWSADKKDVLNSLNNILKSNNIRQGILGN